jgi:hypothetical protein
MACTSKKVFETLALQIRFGDMFKNVDAVYLAVESVGDSRGRKSNEQTLYRTIVILIRNSTWRCGKLEKSIVRHLYKRHENFGKNEVSVKEIMLSLNITGEKKDECLDALRRLEKRNIVRITPL